MGIWSKKEEGTNCQPNEDGVQNCKRIEKVDNEFVTDGSEINFFTDPKTCKNILVGEQRIMDGHRKWAEEILKNASENCKRGLA